MTKIKTIDGVKKYCKTNFSPFYSASLEIIGLKVCNIQTDKFFDTIYRRYVDFFFLLNLLPPYWLPSLLASLPGEKNNKKLVL